MPLRTSTRALLLSLALAHPPAGAAGAPTASAQEGAPEHILKSVDLIDDLVPPRATAVEARSLLEAAGYFCTWGGAPLLESVGARFLVCSPSCANSLRDGWWVYLSEVVGKGIQYVQAGNAGASLIRPFLPDGCPARN